MSSSICCIVSNFLRPDCNLEKYKRGIRQNGIKFILKSRSNYDKNV